MSRSFRFLATVAAMGLLATLVPQTASADSVLIYTGNDFTEINGSQGYTTDMFLQATIVLADPLPWNTTVTVTPLSFELFDGRFGMYSDASTPFSSNPLAGLPYFNFTTGNVGSILGWTVNVSESINVGGVITATSFSTHSAPLLGGGIASQDCGSRYLTAHGNSGDAGFGFACNGSDSQGSWAYFGPPSIDPPPGDDPPGGTSVPEPASLSLLVVGLAGLGCSSRKKT